VLLGARLLRRDPGPLLLRHLPQFPNREREWHRPGGNGGARPLQFLSLFQVGVEVEGKVRNDGRCGDGFPLDDGSPSACDGAGDYPCCSVHGYCGPGPEHCSCPGCVDYRSGEGVGETPSDRPAFVAAPQRSISCLRSQ